MDLSRAKFESMLSDILIRIIEPCKKAMSDAKLSNKDIDEVLLVGGSTRIPAVQ
jgi:molecular chaperone DnaK